jgi:hypothetical protein
MVKALKVVLIIYGVILILAGLADIIIPDQVAEGYGIGEIPGYAKWMAAGMGAIFIAAGVWVIAAGRDPLRHIYWVKFVITKSILAVVVTVYSIAQGYVDFSQVGGLIILDAVFAVAFLALYPWRAARS